MDDEIKKSGMTDDEYLATQALVNAWNIFCRLPVQHPSDQGEFQQALHECQRLLAIRVTRRDHPGFWKNREYDDVRAMVEM